MCRHRLETMPILTLMCIMCITGCFEFQDLETRSEDSDNSGGSDGDADTDIERDEEILSEIDLSDHPYACTEEALVGTWTKDDGYDISTYVMKEDGSYVRTSDDGYDIDQRPGTWSVTNGLLTRIYMTYGTDYEEEVTETSTCAIVGNKWYDDYPAINLHGSAGSMEGTWTVVYSETEDTVYTDKSTSQEEESVSVIINVEGTGFDMVSTESEIENETSSTGDPLEAYNEHYKQQGKGTITSVEGDKVYWTFYQLDPEFDEDYDERCPLGVECFMGFRITDNILVASSESNCNGDICLPDDTIDISTLSYTKIQ